MEEKSQLLQLKLQEQKAIISNTESALKSMTDNGIDKGSKAFQEMQRQLLNAKGELLDTESALSGISDNSETAGDNVDSMNQQLKRIGDGVDYQRVTDGLGKITEGIEKVITKAVRMGKALVQNTMGAAAWADDLNTRVTQYKDLGVDRTTLQQMDKVAALVDTDTDTILAAKDKMVKNINTGSTDTLGAFAAINKGLDPKMLAQSKEGIEDLFWEAGQFIMGMENEADKEKYAMSIFGRSWRDLLPLFETGREKYHAMMEEQHVVSDKQLDSLQGMNDAVDGLNNEWDTFSKTMLATLAEGLTPLLQTLSGFLAEINEYLASDEGQEFLKAMGEAVKGLFSNITSIDPQKVVEGFAGVFNKITEGLQWLDANRQTVIDAMKVILAGWAALKITGTALNVINFIGGLTGITGSGGAAAAAAAGRTAGTSWAGAFASAAMKAAPFLAFLYTLLNPAASATDDVDLLFDQDGNPTTAARELGITQNEKEFNSNTGPYTPDWMINQYQGDITRGLRGLTGNQQDALIDLVGEKVRTREATSDLTRAVEDMKSLPAEVKEAVSEVVGNINVYIDGQKAGDSLAPFVGGSLGMNLMAAR